MMRGTSVVRPLTVSSPVQAPVLEEMVRQITELGHGVERAIDTPQGEVGERYLLLLKGVVSRAKETLEDILLGKMEWGLVGWRLRGAYARQRGQTDGAEQNLLAREVLSSHAERFLSSFTDMKGEARSPVDERALTLGACSLLTMLAYRKTRMSRVEVSARACHDHLREHMSLMRECIHPLGDDPSLRESRLEKDFETLLSRKYELHGRIPKLVLVHDVDFNLVRQDDGFDQFPMWELFLEAKRVHDRNNLAPWESRFAALGAVGRLHEQGRDSFDALVKKTGERLQGLMFHDAREMFEEIRSDSLLAPSVVSHLLTANHWGACVALGAGLGIPAQRVRGVSEYDCEGFDKSLVLLQILCEDPSAVILCSDDSDPGLSADVGQPSVVRSLPFDVPLRDVSLFATRGATEDDPRTYGLQSRLEEARIPYVLNGLRQNAEGKYEGYQGVRRMVEVYASWLATHHAREVPLKNSFTNAYSVNG